MLTWLKDKERDIASTALAMFVGSWLLLFCQTGFAALQDADLTSLTQSEKNILVILQILKLKNTVILMMTIV